MTSPMTRARLEELKLRLEAAKEGSRELSARIAAAILGAHAVKSRFNGEWCLYRDPDGERLFEIRGNERHHWKTYTTSLDAALTLVAQDRVWAVSKIVKAPGYVAVLDNDGQSHKAATPALALCIAALSARAVLLPEHPDDVMEEK